MQRCLRCKKLCYDGNVITPGSLVCGRLPKNRFDFEILAVNPGSYRFFAQAAFPTPANSFCLISVSNLLDCGNGVQLVGLSGKDYAGWVKFLKAECIAGML